MKRIHTLGWALLAAAAASLPFAAAAAPAAAVVVAPQVSEAQYAQQVVEVKQALEAWRLAWELGDVDNYIRIYDPSFKGTASSRKKWEKERRTRLARKDIAVKIENLEARPVSANEIEVRFVQSYTAGKRKDIGVKLMRLRRDNGAWHITRETWQKQ